MCVYIYTYTYVSYLFIYLSIYLSIDLSIYLSIIYRLICILQEMQLIWCRLLIVASLVPHEVAMSGNIRRDGAACLTCIPFWNFEYILKAGLRLFWRQLHCNALQQSAIYCDTLRHTAKPCNTLQLTATHCNKEMPVVRRGEGNKVKGFLQFTAAYCSTQQYTATRCNTLWYTLTRTTALRGGTDRYIQIYIIYIYTCISMYVCTYTYMAAKSRVLCTSSCLSVTWRKRGRHRPRHRHKHRHRHRHTHTQRRRQRHSTDTHAHALDTL